MNAKREKYVYIKQLSVITYYDKYRLLYSTRHYTNFKLLP